MARGNEVEEGALSAPKSHGLPLKMNMLIAIAAVIVALGSGLATVMVVQMSRSAQPQTAEAHGVDEGAAHGATDGPGRAAEKAWPTVSPRRAAMAPFRPEADRLAPPRAVEDLPRYLGATTILELGTLEGLLAPSHAISYTEQTGTLFGSFTTRADPREREFGLVLAHTFVSQAYATELPLRAVSFSITTSGGKVGLAGTLGATVALNRPASSWEPSAGGTLSFIDWLKKIAQPKNEKTRPEDMAVLEGEWLK